MPDSPSLPPRPRSDASTFPSSTTLRFILLLVSLLGASTFLFRQLPPQNTLALAECFAASARAESQQLAEYEAALKAAEQNPNAPASEDFRPRPLPCMEPFYQSFRLKVLGGLALLLAVGALIHGLLPAWRRWRRKLGPLRPEDAPALMAYLEALCREVGLRQTPRFLCEPLAASATGHVFGRPGRYWVVLSGGLITRFETDRPFFRAVMLHELAHLHNADVNKTYFSIALWRAFVLVALLPTSAFYLYQLVRHPGREDVLLNLNMLWRVLALGFLVLLVRNSVLRVRELHADLRARDWEGPGGALGRVLEGLPHPPGGRWWGLLRTHPPPSTRLRLLEDVRGLARLAWGDAFAAGVMTMLALPSFSSSLGFIVAGTRWWRVNQWLAVLLLVPLALGIMGLDLWRSALVTRGSRERLRDTSLLALCLGVGMLLGELLSFELLGDTLTPARFARRLQGNLPWGLLLFAGLAATLGWMATCASAWLAGTVSRRALYLACAACLLLASTATVWWISLLLSLRAASQVVGLPVLGGAFSVIGYGYLTLGRAALVPWLAGLSWAVPGAAPSAERPSFLTSQWKRGVVGAGVYGVLLLLFRLGVRATVDEATRSTLAFLEPFFHAQILLAALVQAGVAAWAAGRASRMNILHGVCAANLASVGMTGMLLGQNLLFGGVVDIPMTWQVFSFVCNVGTVCALVAAAVAWGLRAGLRGLSGTRQRGGPPRTGRPLREPIPGT